MKWRILIIDDNMYSMASRVDHLSDEGFEVLTATDVTTAVKVLGTFRLDAVIVDCFLATGREFLDYRRAGADLVRRIRVGDPEIGVQNRDIPIVVLTAACDAETLSGLKSVGVNSVLQKPVPTSTLIGVLGLALKEREALASLGSGKEASM